MMKVDINPGWLTDVALYSIKAVLGGRSRDVVGIIWNLLS